MSESPTTDQIGENFSVQLQVGIIREAVTVAFYDLEPDGSQSPVSADVSRGTNGRYLALKETACAFVRRKFPEQRFVGLPNKLLLFLHQPSDPNILKLISPQTEVVDGCLIEIVLSGVVAMDDLCARPHILNVHSYKTPHFCEFCGEMLWGLVKQGLKCDGCGLSFHKRCAYKIPNDCSASRNNNVRRPSMEEQHQNNSAQRNGSILNSPTIRRGSTMRLQIPHSFVAHNYTLPTVCQHCHKLLPLFRQNLQCKDCKFNCHKKCSETVPLNCQGESRWNVDSLENSLQEIDIEDSESPEISNDPKKESPMNNLADQISQDDEEDPKNLRNTNSSNIPLQRVVQSIKHTKRTGSQYIREGWMVCFTNRDSMRRHHYWRLDTKAITLFSDEKTKRYYKEICLKDIERLELVKQSSKLHVFEIQVGETVYYVGEDTGESKVVENGVGRERAVCFENAIRQAMLPLTPQSSNESSTAGSDKASVDVDDTPITDISQRYEIFPDDVLGSGQFGIVYGAIHKSKGHDVAIKVIDKLRFPNKQEAQLKNEVGILQNIHHPGVVNLEYMFESSDKIYVVMEKLKGDMLEMILSNPIGRLCERVTRFLVSQILMALKYLHFKHIVHCDLKPENVLLSSNSLFPQVKLCDFGFARIIGEKSFRRSVVGTPAYLAPEVLKNKGYNRSLDMWSVGVILYVSLSGTFPFNEDEDINDQIQNAAFMFPSNPWGQISLEAIDLITKILQVKLRSRFSVDRSLNHIWLQDYQCWCDLRMLESMLGKRYLTNDADEGHWERFRIEKKLPKWQDCGQKGLKEITKLNDKSAADGKGSTTA